MGNNLRTLKVLQLATFSPATLLKRLLGPIWYHDLNLFIFYIRYQRGPAFKKHNKGDHIISLFNLVARGNCVEVCLNKTQ